MRCQTESDGNTHQFTGKEWDSEMGLNYFCQRYYDPQVARFMTLDPVDDKKGFSPYAYCLNNPLKFTDPTGEVSMAQKWIEWQMADDAAFWGTMQDIVFSNYDEYGNLIGQDYYSPSTVNNPYLESFLIPPPVYFAVAWGTNISGPSALKTQFMRCVYAMSLASNEAAYLMQSLVGRNVTFSDLGPGVEAQITTWRDELSNEIVDWEFTFNLNLSLGSLARVILHEAIHGAENMGLMADLGNEIYVGYFHFTDTFREHPRYYYSSPQDLYAWALIRRMGPLALGYGIMWPRPPAPPIDEGYYP